MNISGTKTNNHGNGVSLFTRFARKASNVTGRPVTFITAVIIVLVWALTGPLFDFSDTWQLVINTGTTIITFLMVFLIQRSQNRDSLAIHIKLNEMVAALKGASNRMIDVEALSEEELRVIERHYTELAALARKDTDVACSHSIEEARNRHTLKLPRHG